MAGRAWDEFGARDGGLMQRLDARLRVLLTLFLALFVVALERPEVLSAALLLALLLVISARLPWRQTLARVVFLDTFMLLMVISLPFSVVGEAVWQWGPLVASREGLWQALSIALKANSVLLFALALVGTLETVAFGHALHHLRVPDKLVHLLLFTLRYIGLLQREFGRLRTAMRARGFQPGANRHTWRSYGYLFGMLLARSLERSERILAAMRCRGFDGHFHAFRHPPLGALDGWMTFLILLAVSLLGTWEWR